jgi:phosphoribosyl 1,2-cyclic phosphate phosphodiesterase
VRLQWDGADVLIDTATDLRQQALRHDIRRVDAVLYTHAHADHVLGLDDLRLYNWRQKGPVPVYGSARTLASLRRTFWYVFDDRPGQSTRPAVELNEVEAPFELRGRRVVPVPVMHGSLHVLGFRVGGLAYLTDVSEIPEDSYPLVEDLEVLVLNALRERPHPMHLDLEGALGVARRIRAARTYLTHLSHEMHHGTVAASLPPSVELAYDGLEVDVSEEHGS